MVRFCYSSTLLSCFGPSYLKAVHLSDDHHQRERTQWEHMIGAKPTVTSRDTRHMFVGFASQ